MRYGNLHIAFAAVCMLAGAAGGVLMHEWGHHTACLYLGYESAGITITLSESYHVCKDIDGDMDVFIVRAAGGGAAMILFGAAFVATSAHRTARLNRHLRLFLLVGVTTQTANFILEAIFNAWYNALTGALVFALGLVAVVYIERHHLIRSHT